MSSDRMRRLLKTVAVFTGAAGLLVAPLTLPTGFDHVGGTALGAGNGANGNGGGNAGGNGNGNAGGNSNAAGAHDNGSANANAGNGAAHSQGNSGGGPAVANNGSLNSALGALNAAHASPNALSHASANSQVGKIAAYDRAMIAALNMPSSTPRQIAARQQAFATARSTQLAAASNKSLSPAVVARVDDLLGLPSIDPNLGLR